MPCGHGADVSNRRVCWGITRRPLSPRALPPRWRSAGRAWELARESGGDADSIDSKGGRARGTTESSADARGGMTRSSKPTAVLTRRVCKWRMTASNLKLPFTIGRHAMCPRTADHPLSGSWTGRRSTETGRSRGRKRTAGVDPKRTFAQAIRIFGTMESAPLAPPQYQQESLRGR